MGYFATFNVAPLSLSFFFFNTLKPRVERYTKSMSLSPPTTSPHVKTKSRSDLGEEGLALLDEALDDPLRLLLFPGCVIDQRCRYQQPAGASSPHPMLTAVSSPHPNASAPVTLGVGVVSYE